MTGECSQECLAHILYQATKWFHTLTLDMTFVQLEILHTPKKRKEEEGEGRKEGVRIGGGEGRSREGGRKGSNWAESLGNGSQCFPQQSPSQSRPYLRDVCV